MALSDTSVARWVQQNFYSKSQLTSGQLDSVYYNQTAFVNASAGAGDAGKPVKLNSSGVIDSTMLSSAYVTLTGSQTLTNKTLTDPLISRVYGGNAANDDLTLEGTSHATKTSSYVVLQPTSGNVGIGTTTPGKSLDIQGNNANEVAVNLYNASGATDVVLRAAGSTAFSIPSWVDAAVLESGSLGTTSGGLVLSSYGADMKFQTLDRTTRLTLDTSGNGTLTGYLKAGTNLYVAGVTASGQDGVRLSYNLSTAYLDSKTSVGLIFRVDNTDGSTERMRLTSSGLSVTGAIAATTGTINSANIVTESATQTLTNKTLTSPTLTTPTIASFTNATHAHTGASSGGTIAHSSLTSAGSNSHATIDTHLSAVGGEHGIAGNFVGTSDSQTLTNKTLTLPVIAQISNTGTLTLPTSTDTLVGRATTDTLTNKTLTSPTINTPTMTSASTDTLNITGNTLKIANARAPASASDTGVAGEICWHPSTAAIYVCVATNTWKRALLSTF